MSSLDELFKECRRVKYHTQKRKQAKEVTEELCANQGGETIGFGSTHKSLGTGEQVDYDYLWKVGICYVVPMLPIQSGTILNIVWCSDRSKVNQTIFWEQIISNMNDNGKISCPAVVYQPITGISGPGPNRRNCIEITPSFQIAQQNSLTDWYLIPTEEVGIWKVTDAVVQKRKLIKLNNQYPHFKDFTRLWKRCLQNYNDEISSYMVVSFMTCYISLDKLYFVEDNEGRLRSQITLLKHFIARKYIPDFSENNRNVYDTKLEGFFASSLGKVVEALDVTSIRKWIEL